jgi:hypothetical protein
MAGLRRQITALALCVSVRAQTPFVAGLRVRGVPRIGAAVGIDVALCNDVQKRIGRSMWAWADCPFGINCFEYCSQLVIFLSCLSAQRSFTSSAQNFVSPAGLAHAGSSGRQLV